MDNYRKTLEKIYSKINNTQLIFYFNSSSDLRYRKHQRRRYLTKKSVISIYTYKHCEEILNRYENLQQIDDQSKNFIVSIGKDYTFITDYYANNKDFFNVDNANNKQAIMIRLLVDKSANNFTYKQNNSKYKRCNNHMLSIPTTIPDTLSEIIDYVNKYLRYFDKSSNVRVLLTKKIAAVLFYTYKISANTISKMLHITNNQIKNALLNFRLGNYNNFRRQLSNTDGSRCRYNTDNVVKIITDHIHNQQFINVKDIQQHLSSCSDKIVLSQSSIRNILKLRLNARYLYLSAIPLEKNSLKNKVYRKYVAELLVKYLAHGHMVISVDETGFSSLHQKSRQWVLKENAKSLRRIKRKPQKNISLLLAISLFGVEGYCIAANGINQIIYAEFISKLIDSVKSNLKDTDKKIILFMDNFYAHYTSIVKEISFTKGVYFLYNSPYSPELNFVENAFSHIKREYNKSTLLNKE